MNRHRFSAAALAMLSVFSLIALAVAPVSAQDRARGDGPADLRAAVRGFSACVRWMYRRSLTQHREPPPTCPYIDIHTRSALH